MPPRKEELVPIEINYLLPALNVAGILFTPPAGGQVFISLETGRQAFYFLLFASYFLLFTIYFLLFTYKSQTQINQI